jgi:hypothetical protein
MAQKKEVLIPFASAITYKYEAMKDKTHASMVLGDPVTWDQLLSNDVALQELQQNYYKDGVAFAYAWAAKLTKEGESLSLKVFVPQPKQDLAQILAHKGLSVQDSIEVEYVTPAETTTLAQANGQSLTWADYLNANITHSQLYNRLFQQRMQRLNGIVIRRHLLKASKEANQQMEEYVQANIIKESLEASEEDVKKFAQDKGISEGDLSPLLLERLTEIVKQNKRDQQIEKYVAANLVKGPIGIAFRGPQAKIKQPEITEDMPQWGTQGPEMVYVGHWSCQGCGSALEAFLEARKNYETQIQGAFIYSFPERDREARMSAEAALCVKSQNQDLFWTFIDIVMDIQDGDIESNINEAAKNSGVDFDEFRDCFLKRKHQQVVDTHLAYAKKLGITAAPLMILQGNILDLPLDMGGLKSKIADLGVSQNKKKKGLWERIKTFFGF